MTAVVLPTLAGCAAAATALAVALPRRPLGGRGPSDASWPPRGARPQATLPSDRARRRGRASMAAVCLAAFAVAPPLAVVPPLVTWARARTRTLRRAHLEQRRIAEVLPDAVDLLLLCTGAGWSLPVAHPQVARRLPPPVGAALGAAALAAERGQPRADALLDALAPLGERAHALAHVLGDHLHYGVALSPGLERLSLELRLDRRRRAELEARRVPVRLLGPLVLCVLPAFALLTVVPLLVASLRALPT